MAGHLRLNFHLVEGLAIVDAHRAAPHPRQDNHTAQVCLHTWGVLVAAPSSWLPGGSSAAMLLAPEASVPGQQLTRHAQSPVEGHTAAGEPLWVWEEDCV